MPLESTESAENLTPDPPTLTASEEPDMWLQGTIRPAKQYMLVNSQDNQSLIRVIQYVDEREAEDAIQKFLGYCRDTGWRVDEIKE